MGNTMKRLMMLCALFWLSLIVYSTSASAATNPGTYEARHYHYSTGGQFANHPSARAAAESGMAAHCKDDPNPQVVQTSGPFTGTGTFKHSDWRIECTGTKQYGWDIYYNNPPECASGEVFNSETQQCEVPPPECLSPNYIDVVSGECVPPEEICFTTIETMSNECVFIGEDDPADEVPPGCVVDSQTGHEICLSDEPGCYVADGKTICPTPDMVCGTKNGTFSCVAPEQEGCGYFNGEKVCFTPDGDKVDNTSPDHPDNGGNLDGDNTNDMYDSRDPIDGGDPDNQIDSPIAPTQAGEEATEKTARDQLKELKKINDALDKMGEGAPLKGDEASSKIDSAVPGLIDNTGIDGLSDGLGTNPFGAGDLGTLPGVADGLIPQGTCIAYSQDVLGFGTFEITCEDTALLRTILEWLFYVITAIYLFQLATTPVRS